jgi:hypothetical protein
MNLKSDCITAILDGDAARAMALFAGGEIDANVRDGFALLGGTPALSLALRSGMLAAQALADRYGHQTDVRKSESAGVSDERAREFVARLVGSGSVRASSASLGIVDALRGLRESLKAFIDSYSVRHGEGEQSPRAPDDLDDDEAGYQAPGQGR